MAKKSDIETLFKAHYGVMLRLASATLHDSDEARDVVHGVFATLLTADSVATIDRSYLLRATRNRALNHLRNLDTRQRLAMIYTLDNSTDEENNEMTVPDYDEMSRIIADSLTPQTAEVVRLRFYNGLKYAEISETLGISEAAVYKHLKRAIQLLRLRVRSLKFLSRRDGDFKG